jgi:glycosyltransferase involved in cell wall biosynthesis
VSSALRIALIAHNRFPIAEPFAGGIEAHIWHLARGLARAGHRVTLFAAEGSDLALGHHPRVRIEALPRNSAARVPFPAPGVVKQSDHDGFVQLMSALIRDGTQTYDVVHNHTLHYVPLAMAARLRMPMLTTLHTPPLPLLEAVTGGSAGAGLVFAAVSRYTATAWGHIAADRIRLVPNGVDLTRWPIGPGGDYLVWSGRIISLKGTHLAIEAARRAGLRLVLAGPIIDADYFRLKIAPRLDDRICYAGHLDQQELAALVGGAAAALVTPTWDEPYGLVVAEALACGTPVVAFERGGVPELLDARCGRLVAPGDVAAMAAAVSEAVALPRLGAREAAVARCSTSVTLSRYVTIYRELIG